MPAHHTNVMMCVATDFALVGLSSVRTVDQRTLARERLTETGHTVVPLTSQQLAEAGNAMELQGSHGRPLAISRRALRSMNADQVAIIEWSTAILALDVPTPELSGGSVRRMIGGIRL